MTAQPVDTPNAWSQLVRELPQLLEQLLASPVYSFENRPPNDQRGIYLFSEGEHHFYVGRTSVTARSRRAGNTECRNFRDRYGEHARRQRAGHRRMRCSDGRHGGARRRRR